MPIKSAQIKSIPYKQKQAHVSHAKSCILTILHSYILTQCVSLRGGEGLIII